MPRYYTVKLCIALQNPGFTGFVAEGLKKTNFARYSQQFTINEDKLHCDSLLNLHLYISYASNWQYQNVVTLFQVNETVTKKS